MTLPIASQSRTGQLGACAAAASTAWSHVLCLVVRPSLLQWSLWANPGRVQGGLGQEGALQVPFQGHGGGQLGESGGD